MSLEIITGSFDELQSIVCPIRYEVFVQEQSVPEELERDDRDSACVHVVALENGKAVGTGRIDLEQGGKIGRLAVQSSSRGTGAGLLIISGLEQIAREKGLNSVWMHAQIQVVPLYKRLGYLLVSEEFTEAGIVHRKMTKSL